MAFRGADLARGTKLYLAVPDPVAVCKCHHCVSERKQPPKVSRLPGSGSGDPTWTKKRRMGPLLGRCGGAGGGARGGRLQSALAELGGGARRGDRRKREVEGGEEVPPPPRSPLREVMWGPTENTRRGPKKGRQRVDAARTEGAAWGPRAEQVRRRARAGEARSGPGLREAPVTPRG